MKILHRTTPFRGAAEHVWDVESEIVGDVFRVSIFAPESAIGAPEYAGILWSTDPPWFSGMLRSILSSRVISGELPPLLSVSVGYPVDSVVRHLLLRSRDLTPTERPDIVSVLPKMIGSPDIGSSGNADAFLEFIEHELRPEIHARFPSSSDASALIGWSLGGLFVVHAYLRKACGYDRYLAISPSLWWDDKELLVRAEKLSSAGWASPTLLHLIAGDLERLSGAEQVRDRFRGVPTPDCLRDADVPADITEFEQLIRRVPDNRVFSSVLPNETHNSVIPAALSTGLRDLFGQSEALI
jgi:predicted alpha/beta superfamily hydrolase